MTVTVTVTKLTDFTVAVTVHGDVSPSVPEFTLNCFVFFRSKNGYLYFVFTYFHMQTFPHIHCIFPGLIFHIHALCRICFGVKVILQIFGIDTKRLVSSGNVTAAKRIRLYFGMVKDHHFSGLVFFGFKYV